MLRFLAPSLALAAPWFAAVLPGAGSAGEGALHFERDVRPVLKAHCFHCHGEEEELRGGLDLRLVRFMEEGGKSGPALVHGDADASLIVEKLRSGEMPKGQPRLSDEEIAAVENWILGGALTARPEPDALGPEHLFTEEERAWWSLQPVAAVAPPDLPEAGAHPVDAFIAAALEERGLEFSPEADARTLIRRASFGLVGLPPSPGEVERFERAHREDPEAAFSELVDRLLDSPGYGERWARHWLDVAGYADSDGYTERDPERPHAWRFRDYVIRSLNADKPFDAFVREQLSGDEIAAREGLHPNSPEEGRERYEELLAATGFLRMAPDGTAVENNVTSRNDCVTDTLTIVSTALYGMTVHCAQCHDHRYDPISQADYYRLRAVFEPGFDIANWRNPTARLVSLETEEEAAAAAEIEKEAEKIDAERLSKQEEFITEVLEKLLLDVDEGEREELREAYRTAAKDRSEEQKRLLAGHPRVRQLSPGSLYLYDTTYKTKHADTLKELAEKAAGVRESKPPVRYVHAFTERPRKPEEVPATHVFFRGNYESPAEEVGPGDLSVLASWREVEVPEYTDEVPGTGRRLAFAESLTDGSHPLLARVIVNRVWMHHFGRGIVDSPGDLGALGGEPSHPELLDWLAADFMENGWSLKRLHRTVLGSRAWRQASARDARRDEIDPDNVYLSRQNVRRLEAETLRDALLEVSGKLNPERYGEPVPVMRNPEGSVVIGNDNTDSAGRPRGESVPLDGQEFRRSVYVQVRRSRPLEMFQTFDAPDMTEAVCDLRPVTTVSPQSLLLMNNAMMREFAEYFAGRVRSEGGPDESSRIREAWRLAYGREPADEEAASAAAFVSAQTAHYEAHPATFERVVGPAPEEPAEPELLALAALCHALLSANEFLYID